MPTLTCVICGKQDVPLRKLPMRPGMDDVSYVCRDAAACRARAEAR